MPDRIKINVLDNVHRLLSRFPEKIEDITTFYWRCLRDKGEFDFKKRVIQFMEDLMRRNSDQSDRVFELFAEYIEDPFKPKLVYQIYDIMKDFIREVSNPQKYLRYILNRLHLDGPEIRASSISCLGEIAVQMDELKDQVTSIIQQFTDDLDEEVRDRVYYYLKVLEGDEDFVEVQK